MEAPLIIASGYIALIALPFCCCGGWVLGFILEDMLPHGPPLHLWGVTLPAMIEPKKPPRFSGKEGGAGCAGV